MSPSSLSHRAKKSAWMGNMLIALFCTIIIPAHANAMAELDKINLLLAEIENSGSIFIRNGTEYGSHAAKKHLEYKLSKSPVKIKTADDFITYIATKSSFSGTLYYIKMPGGETSTCESWLRKKLREIDEKESAPPGK